MIAKELRSIFYLCFCALTQMACGNGANITNAQERQDKPNIILIYADDLGYGEIEPYGQKKIKTPHLKRMAEEGIRFTNHYAGAPVCAPARAMLMTGKHAGHAYIRGNYPLGGDIDSLEAGQMPLPEGTFTMAKMFKAAGYRTAAVGKWGLGMHTNTGGPNRQGFDYFFGYLDQKQAHNYYPSHLWEDDRYYPLDNAYKFVHKRLDPKTVKNEDFDFFKGKEYAPELMTEKALNFITENKDTPFFLYLPYTLPHVSLQVPDEYIDLYRDKFDDKPYYGQDGYAPQRYPRAAYAAMITYLDDQVGKIMDEVQKLGLDDNTLIVFTSDNGATFNGGADTNFFESVDGLRGMKMDVFEGGIRVPFVARWPQKIGRNLVSNHISAQYDLLDTFAELLGQQVPDTDGISLVPTLLQKGQQRGHEFLYFEYPEKGGQLAIRMQRWKGVKLDLKKNPNASWMLFDLERDRSETTDIAADHPEILKQMDAIVRREHDDAHIREWEMINYRSSISR